MKKQKNKPFKIQKQITFNKKKIQKQIPFKKHQPTSNPIFGF